MIPPTTDLYAKGLRAAEAGRKNISAAPRRETLQEAQRRTLRQSFSLTDTAARSPFAYDDCEESLQHIEN
ncbi:MAG: hypothetical protein FWC97_10260 [Treponema sp.]|nr:hypothetical protein [Treponema sp.]